MALPEIGPNGNIPDRRTTMNSNVGLTEKAQPYTPHDPKQAITDTGKLANIQATMIKDYPGVVRDQRLSAFWNKDSYWGKR